MKTTVKKKKVFPVRKKTARLSKAAFDVAFSKMVGVVSTGVGNLSTREGLGD
jgi:hypothetical protein